MRPKRKIVRAEAYVNNANTKLIVLHLACGHSTQRAVRNSQIKEGRRVAFAANFLRCRHCLPV